MVTRKGIYIGALSSEELNAQEQQAQQQAETAKTQTNPSWFDFGNIATKIKDNAKWIVIGVGIYFLLSNGSEGKEKGDTITIVK